VFANFSRSVIRLTRQAMGIPTDLANRSVSPRTMSAHVTTQRDVRPGSEERALVWM
jgi:hypothetical protein